MAHRSGSADLPLHGGRVPLWLAGRMSRLGAVISEAIVHAYGRDELLRRLAHPFWFQSFGAVMGMDWHSSGITTSVIGALKRGLEPLSGELGIHVCGGRGKQSRKTPHELAAVGERVGIDGSALANVSRLVAKVDSAAVQDGFDLYLHGFIVTDEGKWTVVQQGMNDRAGQLAAIIGCPRACGASSRSRTRPSTESIRARSSTSRTGARTPPVGPSSSFWIRSVPTAWRASSPASRRNLEKPVPAPDPIQLTLPHLVMPAHHDVRASDVLAPRLHATFTAAANRGPADFAELLLVPGVGARTVRALAMVAEVVHGAPYRFTDPARFSFAHGGKDRHPFPVPLKVYDETISVMKAAVEKAKLGQDDRLAALKRLDDEARRVERRAAGPSVPEVIAEERRLSHAFGGRSVFGWEPAPEALPLASKPKQAFKRG